MATIRISKCTDFLYLKKILALFIFLQKQYRKEVNKNVGAWQISVKNKHFLNLFILVHLSMCIESKTLESITDIKFKTLATNVSIKPFHLFS